MYKVEWRDDQIEGFLRCYVAKVSDGLLFEKFKLFKIKSTPEERAIFEKKLQKEIEDDIAFEKTQKSNRVPPLRYQKLGLI